jgi:hypothetical protein
LKSAKVIDNELDMLDRYARFGGILRDFDLAEAADEVAVFRDAVVYAGSSLPESSDREEIND